MRCLLQSGTGSTSPTAATSTQHMEKHSGSRGTPELLLHPGMAVCEEGQGPEWVSAPGGKGRKVAGKSHLFLRRSCWKLGHSSGLALPGPALQQLLLV